MIIDDVKITVTAGSGGNGLMGFSRVKLAKGPTGGRGGKGGDVYIKGVTDLSALRQFRFKKDWSAKNGENGRQGPRDGAKAEDLILQVPVGTVCHIFGQSKRRAEDIEITKIGQQELIARGGRGGRGNWFFRSSTNTTPLQSEKGEAGESLEMRLELKMIADVGLIGLPNVGKSSLLNELTNAQSKVANYPFTTLEPNLGMYYDLIIADIPGLIEGASTGKGLGDKFLRHVERTKVLFHLVSAESDNPVKDYKDIRDELRLYKESLLEKPEYIFVSKSDAVATTIISKIKNDFKKIKKSVLPISVIDPDSLREVKKILDGLAEQKKVV